MPYPVQLLDAEVDSALGGTLGTTQPLTVGTSFEPGDLRLAYVVVWNGSATVSSFPGWTQVFSGSYTGGIFRVWLFTKSLTNGSTDGTLTWSTAANSWTAHVTIRNPNSGQSWSPTLAVNTAGGAFTAIPAPSVSVTAAGVLLNIVQASTSGTLTPVIGAAPGMTLLATGNGPFNTGIQTLALTAETFTSAGSSGIENAPLGPTGQTYAYEALALNLTQNPDVVSAITPALETDAGVAVTSSLPGTVTNIITPALETDLGVEVYNPLQAQSIRPPVFLTGDPVSASRVTWQAVTPAVGSTVKVETSLDGGATWQTATNGAAVPGLVRGDTTTPVVLTRATLNRLLSTDATPYFMTLKTEVSVDTSYNELVSLGVFLITQVDITETGGPSGGGSSGGGGGNGVTGSGGSSTGGGLSLVVSGIDLAYAISRNTWTDIYYVPANTNYATAALEIAQNRLPGITSDVSSTEVLAQRLLFGTSQGADPWQDVQDLGTAIGYEAYFDPNGTLRFKAVADPALTPSVWTVSDAANPVMVSYTRSISDSTTYNYVIASGESTSNSVPVYAVAFDNDPSSPTYYLGPYNVVTTTFISAMITTTEQAQQAADALLLVVKGASETVQITMVPNPALEPGDVITVTRTFNGQKIIQGTFLINSISTPLGQSQAQVLVCYRQSAAQG